MFSGPCKRKTDFLILSKNFWAFYVLLYFLFVSICWSVFLFLQRKKVNPKQILSCKIFPQGCSNQLLCHKSESTHQRNSPFSSAPGRHTYLMFIWVILLSSVIVIALYIFYIKVFFYINIPRYMSFFHFLLFRAFILFSYTGPLAALELTGHIPMSAPLPSVSSPCLGLGHSWSLISMLCYLSPVREAFLDYPVYSSLRFTCNFPLYFFFIFL